MEWFNTGFLTALATIVAIDLMLAGDNAIVIALAARNVQKHLQRRAMIWGAGAAVIMRVAMTMIVVWLLQIPGLMALGGALLIWIAYKLLLPMHEKGLDDDSIAGSFSFWGAIKTIVVADLVMGLDNVLGVAGAAHGNFLLVVLGLLISVPILIWGSSMLLKYIERFPILMYAGASVLAFTAANMISSEPYLKEGLASNEYNVPFLYAAIIGGVLWAGFVKNHRLTEAQIAARISALTPRTGTLDSHSRTSQGGAIMRKILVPVDGSRNSNVVVPHLIREYQQYPALEIHLLNIQPRFSSHISRFVKRQDLDDYRRAQAEKNLCPVRKALDGFKVPYTLHVEIGDRAERITEMARQLGCDHIVMATARKNSLTRMLEDSVTNQVLERTPVPVEIIAGETVSGIERYGIPAALASVLGLALLAAAE